MQRFYILCPKNILGFVFFFIVSLTSIQAQKNSAYTIFYAKDSSSIIKLNNDYKTVFVYSFDALDDRTTMPLKLSIDAVSITVMTKVEVLKDRKIVFGELPQRLFDINVNGHLEFGKKMLSELDSVRPDSMITIQTEAQITGEVTGPLYLDFTNWPGIYGDYWNQVEYYWLIDKQFALTDSIKKFNANADRAMALLVACTEFVEATRKKMDEGNKELVKKYSQFNSTFESLKKINARMDESFEITKSGGKLTEDQRKKIGYLTADSYKLKKELKKDADGRSALEAFEVVSKAMTENKRAKEQYDNAKISVDQRKAKLAKAEEEDERVKKRLKVLKRILKL